MSFALGVELLMRRAVMTRWDDREAAEWPPHPDRVFSALVAAWGESGEDPAGRAALEWLERLSAPALAVSLDAWHRAAFTSYVPTNDAELAPLRPGRAVSEDQVRAGLRLLPEHRHKAGRAFPAVVPADPVFHLVWDGDVPTNLRPALAALCAQVTYLGHSATPVIMWLTDEPPGPTLVPEDQQPTHRLRAFGPGRIEELVNRFGAGLRPGASLWQGYAAPHPPPRPDLPRPFDPGLIVLRQVGGRRFGPEACGMLAAAVRNELMTRWTATHGTHAPEWLSGHAAGSDPSRADRPAVLPLAFVGRDHADGHLLGVAIALPTGFAADSVGQLFRLLERHGDPSRDADESLGFLSLTVKNPVLDRDIGACELELDDRPPGQRAQTLKVETWTRPATVWATVTPVVLPQFPRRHVGADDVVARACVDAGYPPPETVETGFAPYLSGVPHSRSFDIKPRTGGRPPRPLIHARLTFAEPVAGPVVIGAGRYTGFGFCRPVA